MTAVQQTAIEWAQEHGSPFDFAVDLDNRSVPETASGHGWLYNHPTAEVGQGVIIPNMEQFKDGTKAVYLLDDGWKATPYYVAGWHAEHGYMILHHFPRVWKERDRDWIRSAWALGPRRAYHLRLAMR